MTEQELRETIAEKIDYLALELVVPITGIPTTPYELNAVAKYKRKLSFFADQILLLIRQSDEVPTRDNTAKGKTD